MSIAGRITSIELRDLFLSLVALVIAFAVLGERKVPGLDTILISAVGVSTGFLLHEMAHKFVALHFGYWAEYRANMAGLALAIVMAFGGFLFAAPGAVMISRSNAPQESYMEDSFGQEEQRRREKREMLLISLAGPMTNIVLAILFFLLFVFLPVSMGNQEAVYGFRQPTSPSLSTSFWQPSICCPLDHWTARRSSMAVGWYGRWWACPRF